MREMPVRIAIQNSKGGSGKTATAVSMASGLALRGYKVLLLDLDAQRNATTWLGIRDHGPSIYNLLVDGVEPEEVVRKAREGLDLLAGAAGMAQAEMMIAGQEDRERVLLEVIGDFDSGYDYVLLDCPPAIGLLNQNAQVYAEQLIIPVATQPLAVDGMLLTLEQMALAREVLNSSISLAAVIPTFFTKRTKVSRQVLKQLKQAFGSGVVVDPIPQDVRMEEAPDYGETIFEYAPISRAAKAYEKAVERIIANGR